MTTAAGARTSNDGKPAGVKWPGNAYDPEGHDLSGPITQLLQDMELLEVRTTVASDGKPAGEVRATFWGGTPPSLQVVSAGALAISKWMTAFIATLGGGGAVLAAARGFWGSSEEPLRIAYVGAAAACVVGAAIAIAIIVSTDVASRARGQAAEYRARAEVAAALLNSLQYGRPAPPPPTGYYVKEAFNGLPKPLWTPVDGFELVDGLGVVAVAGGKKLTGGQIAEWITHEELVKKKLSVSSG